MSDELQLYVDWAGLRYYDTKIKQHIQDILVTTDDMEQLRKDLEQLEDSTSSTRDHIYSHLESLDKAKEDIIQSITAIEAILDNNIVTEKTLEERNYATTAHVQEQITNLNTQIVNNYVTYDQAVTMDTLEEAVADVVSSEITDVIDTKLEEAVTGGIPVSSITYDEF